MSLARRSRGRFITRRAFEAADERKLRHLISQLPDELATEASMALTFLAQRQQWVAWEAEGRAMGMVARCDQLLHSYVRQFSEALWD